MTTERAALLAAVTVLVVAGGLPLLAMLVASLTSTEGLGAYASLVAAGRPWILLLRSLAVGLIAMACALLVGWPAGVLCERTDVPGRNILTLLLSVPIVIPTYIYAVAWARVLSHDGLAAQLFGAAAVSSISVFSIGGTGIVLGACFAPLVLILTRASLRSVDVRLEEAARLCAGQFAVLRAITLPLAFPGTALSAILVFLLAVGDLAVPTYLRTDVIATESFTQYAASGSIARATALALPLVFLAIIAVRAELWILPRRFARLPSSAIGRAPGGTISLGLARWPIAASLFCVALVLVVLPLCDLAAQAFAPGALAEAWARGGDAALRSIAWATIGASGLTFLGFLLGYLIQRRSIKLWRLVDQLSLLLFVTPSTVLGIGLVALWNHPGTNAVYGTPAIVLLGFLAQFSILSSRLSQNAIAELPPRMEEAAQLAGARWTRRMVLIVLPLVAQGLTAAWLISFLFCLRDLGISMMVYPPGADTLPVRTFTLMANGKPSLVAALCVMMIAAALGPLLMLGGVLRRMAPR